MASGNHGHPLAFLETSVINEWVTQTTSAAKLFNPRFDPTVRELTPAPSIKQGLESLQHLPGALLLDSSMQIQSSVAQPLGRFSFLMADPFDQVIVDVAAADPFQTIQSLLKRFRTDSIPDLPPMQGGIAGLFSYDLNQSLEKISRSPGNEFELPAIAAGAYDTVVAWDHEQNRCWVVSQGFPETDGAIRKDRANSRARFFVDLLTSVNPTQKSETQFQNATLADEPSPSFEVDGPVGLVSNFSRARYMAAVKKCIDYIHAGDVFQINLAQRLLFPANASSIELYQQLRQCNPAPFSGFFDLSQISPFDAQIISASPERFLSVRDRIVETRPIKGTRRRTRRPMVDIQAKQELLASVKDRAENTMIVDLMRNDLSPVCCDDSIRVTQLCELEEYQSVMHLVSAVQGRLPRRVGPSRCAGCDQEWFFLRSEAPDHSPASPHSRPGNHRFHLRCSFDTHRND